MQEHERSLQMSRSASRSTSSSRLEERQDDDGQAGELSIHTLGAQSLDPFETLALPLSNAHQALVTYFTSTIGSILPWFDTSDPEAAWANIWIRHSIASPLLLASVCSHAAEHQDFVGGREFSEESLYFRALTLRGVHVELRREEIMASDEVFGALELLVANTDCFTRIHHS